MMQDISKKLLSGIAPQKHMQKQPAKAAIRNMWPKQTSAMQISNLWNSKGRLRRGTKRKTIKQPLLYLILKNNYPKIINLLSKSMTERQISFLLGGLKITPTPKSNTMELKSDI